MKVCPACDLRFANEDWHCPQCGNEPAKRLGLLAFAPELADESEGFDASFFKRLADAEPGHFWFEARNRLILWALRKYFPNAANFLEIGCGTAFVLNGVHREFPGLALSGSEIFSEGLRLAHERLPDVTFLQMDATRIPFEAEFDVIGAFDVVEHITDDEAVFANMLRAVKPDGGIILTVPQHMFLWSVVDEFSKHQRRYSRRELTEKLARAGFQNVFATSFISVLLPAMLGSRAARGKKVEDFDPMSEFALSPALNKALRVALDAERTAIRAGVSFPAGGSLLAIASKPH